MARCPSKACICAFCAYSSTECEGPYRLSSASVKIFRVNDMPPAWYSQTESIGHKWSSGNMRRRLSMGGIAGPGLISVANPKAPPRLVSISQ